MSLSNLLMFCISNIDHEGSRDWTHFYNDEWAATSSISLKEWHIHPVSWPANVPVMMASDEKLVLQDLSFRVLCSVTWQSGESKGTDFTLQLEKHSLSFFRSSRNPCTKVLINEYISSTTYVQDASFPPSYTLNLALTSDSQSIQIMASSKWSSVIDMMPATEPCKYAQFVLMVSKVPSFIHRNFCKNYWY